MAVTFIGFSGRFVFGLKRFIRNTLIIFKAKKIECNFPNEGKAYKQEKTKISFTEISLKKIVRQCHERNHHCEKGRRHRKHDSQKNVWEFIHETISPRSFSNNTIHGLSLLQILKKKKASY